MDPRLERLQQEIAAAIAGMSSEQLSQHPPGRWCAAEVLEHLYLTYTGTLKGFQRVAEAGKPLATRQTWKQRGRTLVVVTFGHLPSGRDAPPAARPRGLPAAKVLAEIGPKIGEMDDSIARCEQALGPSPNCWTILSSGPSPDPNGESFIWCMAYITCDRLSACGGAKTAEPPQYQRWISTLPSSVLFRRSSAREQWLRQRRARSLL